MTRLSIHTSCTAHEEWLRPRTGPPRVQSCVGNLDSDRSVPVEEVRTLSPAGKAWDITLGCGVAAGDASLSCTISTSAPGHRGSASRPGWPVLASLGRDSTEAPLLDGRALSGTAYTHSAAWPRLVHWLQGFSASHLTLRLWQITHDICARGFLCFRRGVLCMMLGDLARDPVDQFGDDVLTNVVEGKSETRRKPGAGRQGWNHLHQVAVRRFLRTPRVSPLTSPRCVSTSWRPSADAVDSTQPRP